MTIRKAGKPNDFTEQDVEDLARVLFDGLREAWEQTDGYPVGSAYSRWDEEYEGAEDAREDFRVEARAALRAGYRRP